MKSFTTITLKAFALTLCLAAGTKIHADGTTVVSPEKGTFAILSDEQSAMELIETTAFLAPQASANTQEELRRWLYAEITSLLGTLNAKVSDIVINEFTPATQRTTASSAGISGSFRFAVTVIQGGSATTSNVSGTIFPTVLYTVRVELAVKESLVPHVTVSPIWNSLELVEEGTIIPMTIKVADGVSLTAPRMYINGVSVEVTALSGKTFYRDIAVTGDLEIEIGGLYEVGIEEPGDGVLHAVATGNGLLLSGLTPGETISVYNLQGQSFYQGKATSHEECLYLRNKGIYVIISGNKKATVVY
ncbi:MAG: hypothetical protein MdMp024_1245 [Bacteroidales bacterium]